MEYTDGVIVLRLPQRIGEADRADIEDINYNSSLLSNFLTDFNNDYSSVKATVNNHISNLFNPHVVTAAQVGAYTIAQVDTIVENLQSAISSLSAQVLELDNLSSEIIDTLSNKLTYDIENTNPNRVLVTNSASIAETSDITTQELLSLSGVNGNLQEQLNNISFYNYLSSIPIITLSSGGDDFPSQDDIDAQVIPLIEAEYPTPSYRDAIIQNIETQNGTQRRAELYSYFDGTQSDGFIGWRYITFIDTLINRANGTVYGVVRDSDDISWVSGEATVNHATEADTAEAARGVITQTLGTNGITTNLNTLYGLDHNEFYVAGNGNTITNKPSGVDSFELFVQRAASGYTLQALFCSTYTTAGAEGLWYRQWNGTTWSSWIQLAAKYLVNSGTKQSPVFNGDIVASSMTLNGDTITSWPTSGGGSGKRYATIVIGSSLYGYTSEDVDLLCNGTNDTEIIQQAISIASQPSSNGAVIEFLDGVYNITETISITVPWRVKLKGSKSSTFQRNFSGGAMINISGVSYTEIDGLFLDGRSYVGNGINIASGEGHVISNCTILYCQTYGIYIASSAIRSKITNNTVAYSNASIYSSNCSNIIVSNNIIYQNTSQGVLVRGGENNVVSNNIISGAYALEIGNSSKGNSVVGNTITNATVGVYLASTSNNTLSGNSLKDVTSNGFYIDPRATNNTIVGNGLFDIFIPIKNEATGNLIVNNGGAS